MMLKLIIFALLAAGLNAEISWETLNVSLTENWGPLGKEDDTSIRPYTVKFPDGVVEDLLYRLQHHVKLTPPLEKDNYKYGMNTYDLENWISYWANNYSFTEREEFFNTESHFVTDVNGLPIHFIESSPKGDTTGKTVLPVLLMHGWPGSVREFYGTLPHMTAVSETRNITLKVIAPSLPGFAFSGAADRSGMGAKEVAVIMRNLMNRLGYEEYIVAGGDWGSIIGFYLSTLFPKEVIGYISNMPLALTNEANGLIATASANPSSIITMCEEDRLYPLSAYYMFLTQETGYFHMQATKPYTIGVGLADSPVGLLAWILQLMSTGTNKNAINQPDGGLSVYTKDEVLDNILLYWAYNSIISASLIYANTANLRNYNEGIFALPTTPPSYFIEAKHEIFFTPIKALKTKYTNMVNIKVLDDCGHFLALEAPELYSELVLDAIEEILEYRRIKNM